MAFRDTAKDFVDKLPKHRDNSFYNTDGFVGAPDDRRGEPDQVQTVVSPNGFLWTMVMLNVTMGQLTGEEFWDAWWKEPSVPALLRDKVRNPASFL